jgi:hypothetical protein
MTQRMCAKVKVDMTMEEKTNTTAKKKLVQRTAGPIKIQEKKSLWEESSSSEEEEDEKDIERVKMTRKRLIIRLELEKLQTPIAEMAEKFEKATSRIVEYKKSLGSTQSANYVLLWCLNMENMISFFKQLQLEAGWKNSTASNYWRTVMTVAECVNMTPSKEHRLYWKWLEETVGPADVTVAMKMIVAREVWRELSHSPRVKIWFGLCWLLAQRPPDLLQLETNEFYVTQNNNNCVLLLRLVKGKTIGRLGPYTLAIKMPTPLSDLVIEMWEEATRREEKFLFGGSEDWVRMTMCLAATLKPLGLNQRSIRRGSAQTLALSEVRPSLSEMKRLLRHGRDEQRQTGEYLGHGLCQRAWHERMIELTDVTNLIFSDGFESLDTQSLPQHPMRLGAYMQKMWQEDSTIGN